MDIFGALGDAFTDPLLLILMIVGIISYIISIPIVMRRKRIKTIEEALPETLSEIAENIRSAMSVESAIREVAFVRTDLIGRELQYTSEEMKSLSFKDAMINFATRSGSRILLRVVSLINIAIEAGASIAEVLEKMADELWGVIMLQREREMKTATNAAVILWVGPVLTAFLIAFIFTSFGAEDVQSQTENDDTNDNKLTDTDAESPDINLDKYVPYLTSFVIALGAVCAVMWGVAKNQLDIAFIRIPFHMFIAYFVFKFISEAKIL